MNKFLALCLLALFAACAQYGQTVTTTGLGKDGKPVVIGETKTQTDCVGIGCNAGSMANLELRRSQVEADGKIGLVYANKGLPVQRSGNAVESGLQGGYQYNGYGYGGYGQYGGYGNPFGVSPAIMYAEAASLGYVPGNLPVLGQAPVYFAPQQPLVLSAPATAGAPSAELRLDRLEKNQKAMAQKIIDNKR